ncbi:sulfatase-like hydrolase/transferase [Aestuariibacter sp. A3R04]|uniref:sulfatase-like hydrolase/transferase n=1 Tax=Aestuariibacter sp. A3R04 TaxID=2841571 RepID=UPI001C0A5279|nr:sulfatase-like hydrolase/transferase [Aestuariibacter sp. A3R04]MBU3020421.1 sulfatase-like hydrolase/transferase [Aestuariibacter sp. A3R04]
MNRYFILVILVSMTLFFTVCSRANESGKPLNILVFLVDDLRPDLGAYGHPRVHSPNIDRLAQEGVKFTRAYAQQAICGPSRVSIMTGLRPETTGLYTIRKDGRLRPNQPDVVSLPQLFKANGYQTISIGKVYHSTTDDQENWSTHIEKLDNFYAIEKNKESRFAYEAGNVKDDFYKDGKVANDAIRTLKEVKNKKFLMFVGMSKPHLPFNAPKKYWDLYDSAQITVPNRQKPEGMYRLALTKWGELRMYGGIPKEGGTSDALTRTLINGYYASVSYMDAQIGRIMNAVDELGLRENTLVVLMSDHGYKLGEYGAWNKHTNMELDTRVPLIISRELSHQTRVANKTSDALVENVDIFPTLAEAAGISIPDIDGTSLLSLVDEPDKDFKEAAYSLFNRGKIMGVTVTDGDWRYTEWRNAETQKVEYVELYDHRKTPVARSNESGGPKHTGIENKLRMLLHKKFPLDAPSFYQKRHIANNQMQVVLTSDFTDERLQRGDVYDFFDVAVRTERGNAGSKPASFGRIPKVNMVRTLGGWFNQDLTGDTYLWDGEKYVYNFAPAFERIDQWLKNDWEIFQIVLDNPPWAFQRGYKFVDEPDGQHYLKKDRVGVYGNGLPPNDSEAWQAYIREFLTQLVRRYGKDKVGAWRFRIGSEIDTRPQHWAATREAFFEHYRNTVEAVKSVLPNAKVGAHFREASHKSHYVDYTGNTENAYAPFFVSWAKKNNVPYDFLAISYYPHITHPHEMDMDEVYATQIAPIKAHTDFNPHADFEIHEYKFIVKMKRAGFVSVATSHNAAFFAMFSKMVLTHDIRKVFQWGNMHDGSYSPEAMTQLAIHSMLGNAVFDNFSNVKKTVQGNRVDGIFSQRQEGDGLDILTFNFNTENPAYQKPESLKLVMNVDKPAGTKYRYRVTQIDRETMIEQQFCEDFPQAMIPESEGGWRKANTHPTASLQNALNEEGQSVFAEKRVNYGKMNSLNWSEWREGASVGSASSHSDVVIKGAIPSFAVQKYEIRWL